MALVLSLASVLLLGLIYRQNSNKVDPSVSGKTGDTLDVKTYSAEVWVNPAAITNDEPVANVAAKMIDSVVVIEAFSSTSKLDSPDSIGSGVLWSEDKASGCTYISTCNHVVDGAVKLRVTLNNGDSFDAEIVGKDLKTDLAVIKIKATGLPTAVIPKERTLLTGQTVIAIGNPLGILMNSVTSGILSAVTRSVTISGITMELIQIDAAVNSGNSGGGLFDINGQLIGIVNAKTVDYSVEGIGFAIPFYTVNDICSQLISQGYVDGRPSIGIKVYSITYSNYSSIFELEPDLRDYATETTSGWFGPQTSLIEGIYVTDASGVHGYADSSDTLKYGDRITAISGNSVTSSSSLSAYLTEYNAGDVIDLTVVRNKKTIVIQVILGQAGKN